MNLSCWIAALVVIAAAPLNAQGPVARAFSFDVGALMVKEIRVRVEPLRSGVVAFGAELAARDNPTGYVDAVGPAGAIDLLSHWRPDQATGTEISLDVGARVLGRSAGHYPFQPYAGALVGVHARSSHRIGGVCAPMYEVLCIDPAVKYEVEPTAEGGVRFFPRAGLLIDVGLRVRALTFDDPHRGLVSGDLDSRLSLGVGVTW